MGGDAITTVRIADAADSMSAMVYYANTTAGAVTVTGTSGDLTDSAVVTAKSTIHTLSVNKKMQALASQGGTIMVSATGRAGGGTVTVMGADDTKVGTTKALDPVGDVDAEGDQEYSRSITLPAVLKDGTYTISVSIQGDTNDTLSVKVVNDQTPPSLSAANAVPNKVKTGTQVTLSVNVAMNKSKVPITSVTADASGLIPKTDTMASDAIAVVGTDCQASARHLDCHHHRRRDRSRQGWSERLSNLPPPTSSATAVRRPPQ